MILKRLTKKGRKVILEFDDNDKQVVSYEIVLKHALSKEDVLSEEKLKEIIDDDIRFRAKQSAYRILSSRAHSAKEISDKLIQREYPEEVVKDILNELTRKNYIDDKKFAEKFVEEKSEKKKQSPLKLKFELIKRGVSSTDIENALKNHYPEERLLLNARKHVSNKITQLKDKKLTKLELRNKILMSLQYKGFQRDLIFRVMKENQID
jgi:regulatory protein